LPYHRPNKPFKGQSWLFNKRWDFVMSTSKKCSTNAETCPFKRHVRSRIEFIKKGGAYNKQFGVEAVTIAYATTGEIPGYREARCRTMCAWTQEVLVDLHKEKWAYLFRFHGLCLDDIYNSHIFQAPVWYRPDAPSPVPLFTP
jgi:hypothetical protein